MPSIWDFQTARQEREEWSEQRKGSELFLRGDRRRDDGVERSPIKEVRRKERTAVSGAASKGRIRGAPGWFSG